MSNMNANGQKLKGILQILFLVTMALYILIKDVTVPLVRGGDPGGKAASVEISERLARLEESTNGLKTSVDRIERKLDQHITGGK